MKDITIYDKCPAYESGRFLLRLVEEGDAEDLLRCYSDLSAVRLMNSDNCTSDFHYETLDEMMDCIRGWLGAYRQRSFIRFSIIDTQKGAAIGTIEMFDKTKDIGILRLDLCSVYETQEYILELLNLSTESFYNAYGIRHIMTKAIPTADKRISALRACGFIQAEDHPTLSPCDFHEIRWTWIRGKKERTPRNTVMPHGDYYIHDRE